MLILDSYPMDSDIIKLVLLAIYLNFITTGHRLNEM